MASKSKPIGKSASSPMLAPPVKKSAGLSVFKSKALTEGVVKREEVKNETQFTEALTWFTKLDTDQRVTAIQDHMNNTQNLTKGANFDILARITKIFGVSSAAGSAILSLMTSSVNATDDTREQGVLLFQAMLRTLEKGFEPFALPLVSRMIELTVDKLAVVRDVAAVATQELFNMMNPLAFRIVFPLLMQECQNDNWKIKVTALNLLKSIAPRMSPQLSPLLPVLIPRVSECVYDSKKNVQTAALEALTTCCLSISNDDIRPLTPQLVSVIGKPEEAINTLNLLLETTFVATVDASVMALLAPLLGKSLKNRSSLMRRKASKVIDIMCRLVQNPADVAPFKEMLLPSLERVIDELVDREVCDVAIAAREILLKALGEGNVDLESLVKNAELEMVELKTVEQEMCAALGGLVSCAGKSAQVSAVVSYVSQLSANLIMFDYIEINTGEPVVAEAAPLSWREKVALTSRATWTESSVPYLTALLDGSGATVTAVTPSEESVLEEKNGGGGVAEAAARLEKMSLSAQSAQAASELSTQLRLAALGDVPDQQEDADDGGTDLCNIEFSLAFGGKILLHNTFLKLGKGRRYGVMGKNGAGKTTLLTNVGSGNIEGMPETLKTVYVQHDDASDDLGVPMIEELLACKDLEGTGVTREEAAKALMDIRFTEAMLAAPRSNLSGGWKMKLLIMSAMLAKADVLLLDEPTNHLDTASVDWLGNYINAQKDLTILVVSHDTGFLDRVLTDVIHYEGKKLVYYHGNLTHFVSIHPEARFYYELSGSTLAFKFPVPGRLEGINSATRAVLKMDNVSYTYPGAAKAQITNASVKVCLGSRVAVLGANGAGKSTLVKMLVQETQPDENTGSVWKHMNLSIAYVAQHSFHHIEQHLDNSPVDYIKWRFAGGVDKEDLARPSMKGTEVEAVLGAAGLKKWGDVDQVLGRRKNGRTMEYECTYIGQIVGREPNKYIPVEKMVEMGLNHLVQQCDAKTAAMAAGLDVRPLLNAEIQSHLNDFALDAEFGTHGTIKRLSGGQKVKLVLAAAMWNCPHVIVLDEPTNYLDREALGALTQAIKGFAGGIVIISHNGEFTDAICSEQWDVRDGTVFTQGGAEESTIKSSRVKKSSSTGTNLSESGVDPAGGNTNKTIASEILLNPRTLEALSKKQARMLERCAATAGVTPKDYLSKINFKSPEWKWL
mmetsp:Transcript_4722/g.10315  ORF Transcript_4722/g.10315 Transcript_4722/m.10315 type:complete len:1185 (-) Transcript_4722:291-3845(-)